MSSRERILDLKKHVSQKILGQDQLTTKLLIALLADGHLLVEGAPGLAKTKAIKTLSTGLEADFHRIQFTPDLLPGDITGTEIYRPQDGSFSFQQGPIFHNLILADEINRAPAKVQSALLEAMAERQITVGKTTYSLPELFLVMATQNPIEQEGTYPLPEAQLDRFLMHIKISYPEHSTEKKILQLNREEAIDKEAENKVDIDKISPQTIFDARKELYDIYISPELEDYLVSLILATRSPEKLNNKLASYLEFGASPRATIALDKCARAHAWLLNRDFLTPDDIKAVIHDVMRHRIILSFEAEAEGIIPDQIINHIISLVPVP